MKCPACDLALVELKVGPVSLDVCQRGCGGIWFDAQELDKIGKAKLPEAEQLAEIVQETPAPTDADQVRHCLRCRDVKLERKLFSLGSGVIMDCCPKCHGIWLDHGELETIHEELNPKPRPIRHVVARPSTRKSIPINFGVIQQVQKLQIGK